MSLGMSFTCPEKLKITAFLKNIFGAFFVQAQPVFIHKKRNSHTKHQELGLTFYWEICCRIIKFCSDKEEVHANN